MSNSIYSYFHFQNDIIKGEIKYNFYFFQTFECSMQFDMGVRKRRGKFKKLFWFLAPSFLPPSFFLVLWVSSSQFPPGLGAKDPQGEWMRAQPRHHANHSHSVVAAALHYTLRHCIMCVHNTDVHLCTSGKNRTNIYMCAILD